MFVPVMFQFPKFQPEFVEIHPDHDKCTSAVLHLSIVQLNLRSTSTTESISSFLSSSRGVASDLFAPVSSPLTCLWVLTSKNYKVSCHQTTQDRTPSHLPSMDHFALTSHTAAKHMRSSWLQLFCVFWPKWAPGWYCVDTIFFHVWSKPNGCFRLRFRLYTEILLLAQDKVL